VAERIFLVGMMGAGKSTIGRLAANRLGWEWVDVDDEVVRETGASVADLFARGGEAHFRREESRVLEALLARPGPLVVSVGGGAVLDEGNRRAMQGAGTVVWLRARPDTLARRVGDGRGRPLLAGAGSDGPDEALRRLDDTRRPLYEAVADHVVDVDDLEAETVTERVLQVTGREADRRACP
jgi:shikimate kinase